LAFENRVLAFEKRVLGFENRVLAFEKGDLTNRQANKQTEGPGGHRMRSGCTDI
jgi:hypothetical protein